MLVGSRIEVLLRSASYSPGLGDITDGNPVAALAELQGQVNFLDGKSWSMIKGTQ